MFTKKTVALKIDDTELVVTEMSFRKAKDVAKLDEEAATYAAFTEMVRKPDGTPFFAGKDDIDGLPTSVTQKIGAAIKEVNAAKN